MLDQHECASQHQRKHEKTERRKVGPQKHDNRAKKEEENLMKNILRIVSPHSCPRRFSGEIYDKNKAIFEN